ncbi:MAG: hypothetical protein AAF235_09900 [Planctomycetota bacterium]
MGMAIGFGFVGLVGLFASVAMVVVAILTLVRGLTIPAGRRRGPTCGACGHGIDIRSSAGLCQECGKDLHAVGVATPSMAVAFRSAPVAVYGAWLALASSLGVIVAYVGVTIWTVSSIAGGTFATSAIAETSTLTPVGDRATPYELVVETELQQTFNFNAAANATPGAGAVEGTIELTDAQGGDLPRMTITLPASSWRITTAEERPADADVQIGGETFDAESIDRFLGEIGVPEDPARWEDAQAIYEGLQNGLSDIVDFEILIGDASATASRFRTFNVTWDTSVTDGGQDRYTSDVTLQNTGVAAQDREIYAVKVSADLTDGAFASLNTAAGEAVFRLRQPGTAVDTAVMTVDFETQAWEVATGAARARSAAEDVAIDAGPFDGTEADTGPSARLVRSGVTVDAAAFEALFLAAGIEVDGEIDADAAALEIGSDEAFATDGFMFHETLASPTTMNAGDVSPADRFVSMGPTYAAANPFADLSLGSVLAALLSLTVWVAITVAGLVLIGLRRKSMRAASPA